MQARTFIPILAAAALLILASAALADSGLTPSRARQELQAAGFTDIKQLHREKDHYDVVAMKDGKERVLDVDAHTGTITTDNKVPPLPPKPKKDGDDKGQEPLPDHTQ